MQGLLTMVKLKSLITERVDFYEIATQLVKKAGLKSKVKFVNTGSNKADYNVDDDTIRIKPTSRFKDFLVTVFHEIDHAKDAQRLGKKKYKQQYEIEMNKAFNEVVMLMTIIFMKRKLKSMVVRWLKIT